ncbi:MAG TPA: hypothetical protein VNO35_31395 [Steroidobacteraceae bacterium]|nr:hypothetical protein [Steroidobacteraceae bacterium]
MVRSSKTAEQAIGRLLQLLRSTLCVFMFVGSASTFAGQNILYYLSQPGDWIGQGQEVRFTGADGSFSMNSYSNAVRADFITPGWTHSWFLNIGTADYSVLQAGAYESAQRAPSAGHPQLDFYGDGRGCNDLTGRFDVLEIVRDASGAVTQLAVNWEQHCNGIVPALLGQIRYNSDVPVIKTPKITLENPLNARGCVEASNPNGALVSMNANNTTDSAGGRSLQFSWSSTTGDAGTDSTFSVNAPLTTDPANPVTVTLSVTDLTNNTSSTAIKSVCISDTTGPAIVIFSPTPGQVVQGDNLILDVSIQDAVDKNITQYEVLVGRDFLSPIDPNTGRAQQRILQAPQVNGGVAVTITVRAIDVFGNSSSRFVTFTQTP